MTAKSERQYESGPRVEVGHNIGETEAKEEHDVGEH